MPIIRTVKLERSPPPGCHPGLPQLELVNREAHYPQFSEPQNESHKTPRERCCGKLKCKPVLREHQTAFSARGKQTLMKSDLTPS